MPGPENGNTVAVYHEKPLSYADNEMITVGITGLSVPGISDRSGETDLALHQGY